MLSLDQVKHYIHKLSGIIPLSHNICIDSCCVYTVPLRHLEDCYLCGKSHYDPIKLAESSRKNKVPCCQFDTIPIGLQVVASYASEATAKENGHCTCKTDQIHNVLEHTGGHLAESDDVYCKSDYLGAVQNEKITSCDTMLMISIDGAQLYCNKHSDCWILIWVNLNLVLELWYKKNVFISAVISGPNKPKNLESFIFPSLYHLLQPNKRVFMSGMHINGGVGHNGKRDCQLICDMSGHHMVGATHYYPVLF